MTSASTSYLVLSTKTTRISQQKPTHQPPGHLRVEARGRKEKVLEVNVQSPSLIVQWKSMVTWTTRLRRLGWRDNPWY